MAAIARLVPFIIAAFIWLAIGLMTGYLAWKHMTVSQRRRYNWITTAALIFWPIILPFYVVVRAGSLQDRLYEWLDYNE